MEVVMAVLKVKPVHKSQGDYVLIEDWMFDPKKHELLGAKKKVSKKKASKKA
jgi:hypothetical protein